VVFSLTHPVEGICYGNGKGEEEREYKKLQVQSTLIVNIKGDKKIFISCTNIMGWITAKNKNKEELGAGDQMRDARARHPRLIRPFCEKSVHKEDPLWPSEEIPGKPLPGSRQPSHRTPC